MHSLFFKVKEKMFRGGPIINNCLLNYRVGIFLLKRLIKLQSFQKYRATEIETLTALLGLLDVPPDRQESFINQYLFNNTWQYWKSLHYEQAQTFYKYWQLNGKEKIEKGYNNQKVIVFLYRHTPLTSQHFDLISFGFGFNFAGLGNIHSSKYLLRNGQSDLPEEVMNNPLRNKKIVRSRQIKKILKVLNNTEGYAINYFYDGQDGKNFQKRQIANLHYQLSTDLLRFLRPHTQLVLVEPSFAFDGSVTVQFHEVPRFAGFTEQLDYVRHYYESTLLSALPTMNEYIIKKLLINHHALENSH